MPLFDATFYKEERRPVVHLEQLIFKENHNFYKKVAIALVGGAVMCGIIILVMAEKGL